MSLFFLMVLKKIDKDWLRLNFSKVSDRVKLMKIC